MVFINFILVYRKISYLILFYIYCFLFILLLIVLFFGVGGVGYTFLLLFLLMNSLKKAFEQMEIELIFERIMFVFLKESFYDILLQRHAYIYIYYEGYYVLESFCQNVKVVS